MDIKREFQRSYDPDKVSTEIQRISAGRSKSDLLGTGAHFTNYLFKASPVDLVIKVSHADEFHSNHPRRHQWLDAMKKLQKSNLPFVPPMRILEDGESIVIIMPMLPERWTLTDRDETQITSDLARLGLDLGDVIQVRSRGGFPYVYDFSDLHLTQIKHSPYRQSISETRQT